MLEEAKRKILNAEETLRAYRAQTEVANEKKLLLEEENEKLRQSILGKALRHANPDLRREHAHLRQTLEQFQSKLDQMREISLLSARVVDRLV